MENDGLVIHTIRLVEFKLRRSGVPKLILGCGGAHCVRGFAFPKGYCHQRFAYGLWRFRSTFLSPETKASYEAKILLVAVHPP
jgi:hypothetical protein